MGRAAEEEEHTAAGRLVRAAGVWPSWQPGQAVQGSATSVSAPQEGCSVRFVQYELLSCALRLQPWEALYHGGLQTLCESTQRSGVMQRRERYSNSRRNTLTPLYTPVLLPASGQELSLM